MYNFLRGLLADKTGGVAFMCFGLFHICVIFAFFAIAVLLCLYLKDQSKEKRQKTADTVIGIAFAIYIADFFLMPFAYQAIHIDKLPFHICTTMCVMCFWSRYNAFWGKFRLQFAMFGFLSNLTYLMYPAAMMWLKLHPLSYRVVQTLVFHGVMMIYGLIVLVYESQEFTWKKIYKDLGVIALMTAWARLGNALYNNSEKEYNWFYVLQDPFCMFPRDISAYISPFLNIAIFFSVAMVVYWIFSKVLVQRRSNQLGIG